MFGKVVRGDGVWEGAGEEEEEEYAEVYRRWVGDDWEGWDFGEERDEDGERVEEVHGGYVSV
jgi:hypothetical protein